MRFRLVKTGKTYGEPKDSATIPAADETSSVIGGALVPPIIWETDNKDQLFATLVHKQAELVRLQKQLTGDPELDWYCLNGIRVLEDHISTIKRWLEEIKNGN